MLPCWFRVVLSIAILGFFAIPGEARHLYSWPAKMVFKPVQLHNRQWGFIDYEGKEIIPLEYDSITSFHRDEGFVKATRNNLRGMLDRQGNFRPMEAPTSSGSLRRAFPTPEAPLRRPFGGKSEK